MPTIGITGGIATGKSTVAAIFRDLGAALFSADEAAREVTAPGTPALQDISHQLGPQFILPDGSLDRTALGVHVFADPAERRKLEAITHPRIRERLRAQIAAEQCEDPSRLIAVEVPLLYEGSMQDWFDAVVVVTAPQETQISRLAAKGFSRSDAELRIGAQMGLTEKAARADFVIQNDGSLQVLRRSVENVYQQLTKST